MPEIEVGKRYIIRWGGSLYTVKVISKSYGGNYVIQGNVCFGRELVNISYFVCPAIKKWYQFWRKS